MTTTINASTSSGLVNTADTSGILQLQTASTAAVTIDGSQNVGIGTASPISKFNLKQPNNTSIGSLLGVSSSADDSTLYIGYRSDIGGMIMSPTYASTGSYQPLIFRTSDTNRMTIDTSGNVGIGVTPSSGTGWASNLEMLNASNIVNQGADFSVGTNWYYNSGYKYKTTNASSNIYQKDGTVRFQYAASGTAGSALTWSESMRIANDGTVRIGTTSDIGGKLSVDCTTGNSFGAIVKSNTSGGAALAVNAVNPCSTHVQWYNSGTPTGTVTWNGASAVAYNTTSDYRLKENIAPMTGALAKVAQLKPVTYKWKLDGADGQGFIAHELAEVVPDCVNGEKDAVDADGNPVYQGIDTSFLVATLTAALQETKALIDTQAETINALTARIVALEGV